MPRYFFLSAPVQRGGQRLLAKLVQALSRVVESFKSIAKAWRISEDVSCKWSRDTDSSVISAKYKQKEVVLKVQDLTTVSKRRDDQPPEDRHRGGRVQRRSTNAGPQMIPQLVSWGFLCGTMFAYVMTSDEGKPRGSYFTFSVRDVQAAPAPANEALAKIHARGLILSRSSSEAEATTAAALRSLASPLPPTAPRRSKLLQRWRWLNFSSVSRRCWCSFGRRRPWQWIASSFLGRRARRLSTTSPRFVGCKPARR
ncbi:uncharacterized protein LOC9636003 isoform X2 [Selaginella moellendorffii]|uniref:uncharacterized protein LOC9636003 isoform X2 n=1 Tax=Selaginella moellendorffii TaxID=88036 RepID=UPI000D1C87B4|nr:uncharacterized protein LOC9636003 isoform X2 [Selaginella moellendorffii]|eukprot:XP_024526457.1 uncharacterized protein LOC9636003 isoform X2 [Selaginella moellendorffii]